jgi:hypothetical protein
MTVADSSGDGHEAANRPAYPEEAAAVRLPSPDSDSAKPIGEVVETPPAALVTSI